MAQVSTADVSRSAINRLEARVETLQVGIERRDLTINRLQDQARELLSYCESQAQHCGSAVDETAYGDVAGKLRGILDGEQ
jgi:alkaline phosphatase